MEPIILEALNDPQLIISSSIETKLEFQSSVNSLDILKFYQSYVLQLLDTLCQVIGSSDGTSSRFVFTDIMEWNDTTKKNSSIYDRVSTLKRRRQLLLQRYVLVLLRTVLKHISMIRKKLKADSILTRSNEFNVVIDVFASVNEVSHL